MENRIPILILCYKGKSDFSFFIDNLSFSAWMFVYIFAFYNNLKIAVVKYENFSKDFFFPLGMW